MGKRVDFAVPEGSEPEPCRFCRAPIIFAPVGARRIPHPLDVRSTCNGRAESHFAHCPKAREARKRPSGPAHCQVAGCARELPPQRFFCPKCWGEVPESLRDACLHERELHGRSRYLLELVRQAAQIVEQKRRPAKARQAVLFADPGSPGDPEA